MQVQKVICVKYVMMDAIFVLEILKMIVFSLNALYIWSILLKKKVFLPLNSQDLIILKIISIIKLL